MQQITLKEGRRMRFILNALILVSLVIVTLVVNSGRGVTKNEDLA